VVNVKDQKVKGQGHKVTHKKFTQGENSKFGLGTGLIAFSMHQLYYTVWSKSAVGNADCSFKKYIYCVIYYNFWHTFVPYSRFDQTV